MGGVFIVLLVIVLVVGVVIVCSNSPTVDVIPTVVAVTEKVPTIVLPTQLYQRTRVVTWTPIPTMTPSNTPTMTPRPTASATPTDTPQPTLTGTSSSTPIPTGTMTPSVTPTRTPDATGTAYIVVLQETVEAQLVERARKYEDARVQRVYSVLRVTPVILAILFFVMFVLAWPKLRSF